MVPLVLYTSLTIKSQVKITVPGRQWATRCRFRGLEKDVLKAGSHDLLIILLENLYTTTVLVSWAFQKREDNLR